MPARINQQRYFIYSLVALCLLYLGTEVFLNRYNMLAIDEFWFAHLIYHYQDALPYRDFAPYKTVLGYYLLLLPMLTSKGILSTLFFTKQIITLINTFIFFGSSWWLTRYFSRTAIIASLVLLMTSDIVLSYSTNIRVDLLGYWFCFFALLFLLEQRFFLAGLLLGLGFITTQKAVWYIFAADIALAAHWLVFTRNKKMIGCIVYCNIAIAGVIACYIAFWSWIADWNTVITSIFHEASVLYHLNWYDSARKLFWANIILFNPLLMALWPLSLISLFVTFNDDESYSYRLFAVITGFIILLCLIPYKMIFPYYMQVTLPILLILYAAFFTWLFTLFQANKTIKILIPRTMLWLLLIFYIGIMIYVLVEFKLPDIYLLICLIPLLLGTFITYHIKLGPGMNVLFRNLIFITMLFTGVIYPLSQIYLKMIKFHGDYQQAHINVINTLLQDGSDYVAGIELIYNKTQPIAGMRQLVGPAIDYLSSSSAELRPFMLASLYQDPNATSASVIAELKNADIKFYVNTYRIAALPANIRNYLQSQYEHFWGSIYLYAPGIAMGTNKVTLKFSGRYMIESPAMTQVIFNGKSYATKTILYIKKGTYLSSANHDYRLKLMPEEIKPLLNQNFQHEQLTKIVW